MREVTRTRLWLGYFAALALDSGGHAAASATTGHVPLFTGVCFVGCLAVIRHNLMKR